MIKTDVLAERGIDDKNAKYVLEFLRIEVGKVLKDVFGYGLVTSSSNEGEEEDNGNKSVVMVYKELIVFF